MCGSECVVWVDLNVLCGWIGMCCVCGSECVVWVDLNVLCVWI